MTFLYACPNNHIRTATDRRANPARPRRVVCHMCDAPGKWIEVSADYEILQVVGRGGMGIVFKARRRVDGRLFALKVFIPPDSLPSDLEYRFLAEVRAMAQLRHPSIMRLEATGMAGEFPYLVLELLEGGTLDSRVRTALPDPLQAAEWLEAVARGVHYMHLNGIIHRDLKPSNILLDAAGKPRIADMGLVKISDFNLAVTRGCAIMGTPEYMAPEQARGDQATVGRAADIYALGGTLYYMLTGAGPWQGLSPEWTFHKVVHEMPKPPRHERACIPEALDAICMKCLQKNAGERYASAEDLAEDLRRFLASEPISAQVYTIGAGNPHEAMLGRPNGNGAPAPKAHKTEPGSGKGAKPGYDPTVMLRTDSTAWGNVPRLTWEESGDLAACALFNGIHAGRIMPLLQMGQWMWFEDGEDLMTEGTPADGLMLIVDGHVEVLCNAEGGTMVLGRRGPREVIGEMGLLLPLERRTATVRASGPVRVFKLPGNPVHLVGRLADPRTAIMFIHNLIKIVNARLGEQLLIESARRGAAGVMRTRSAHDSGVLIRKLSEEIAPSIAPILCSHGSLAPGEYLGGSAGIAGGYYFVHGGVLEEARPEPGAAPQTIEAPCVIGDVRFGSEKIANSVLRAVTPVEFTCIRLECLSRIEAEAPEQAVEILFAIVQWLITIMAQKDYAADPEPGRDEARPPELILG